MGTSIPKTTLDEELDKRVAELILKEARQKEARYGETGSYLPQATGTAARPNKRFLTSIIKSTDEHNKTILQAQADAASEIKQQRERQEREERKRRAEEAAFARAGPSSSGRTPRGHESRRRRSHSRERHRDSRHSSRHDSRREHTPPSNSEFDSNDRKSRNKKRDDSRGRERSRSPPPRELGNSHSEQSSRRATKEDQDFSHRPSKRRDREEKDREDRKRRRRSRSRSPRRRDHSKEREKSERKTRKEPRTSSRDRSKRHSPQPDSAHLGSITNAGGKHRSSRQRTPIKNGLDQESDDNEDIGPLPSTSHAAPPSKMDKYFAKDYDPRLDVAPTLASRDGFIPAGAFDNWDMMLEVVKARREEKESRQLLEKLYGPGASSALKKKEAAADGASILTMQYTKRGGVREWDEGKKDV